MDFKEMFDEIMQEFEECEAIALVGSDGIMVESVSKRSDLDLEMIGAEYSNLLRNTLKLSDDFKFGGAKELSIISEKEIILVRPVSVEYFLIMITSIEGIFGRARFILKRLAPKIESEL